MSKDHYVAQFRQRAFERDDGHLAVYTKSSLAHERRIFPNAKTSQFAYAIDYYHYTDPTGKLANADETLKNLQSDSARLITRLIAQRSIHALSPGEWETLLRYFHAELLRSPFAKNLLANQAAALVGHGFPPGSDFDLLAHTPAHESADTPFHMIEERYTSLLSDVLSRTPTLVESDGEQEFILGDAPTVLLKHAHSWVTALSPTLALFLTRPPRALQIYNRSAAISEINRHQLYFATKYVFARTPNALAEWAELCERESDYRDGPRPRITDRRSRSQ